MKAACSRREFMGFILTAAAAGAVFHPFRALAGNGASRNCLVVGAKDAGALIDLASRKIIEVPIAFNAHSFVQHPAQPMTFIGIEKWGRHAVAVDFENKTTRALDDSDQWHYYGHGLYDPVKKALFITRVDLNTGLGHLAGFDPRTYEVLYDYQVAPGGLHECHALPGHKVLIASSGIRANDYGTPQEGTRLAPSSLLTVDMANGKVVRDQPITHDNQILGHFAVTKTDARLALSGPRPFTRQAGALFYSANESEPLRALEWPAEAAAKIRGEMLSVALNADHTRAAVTNPAGNQVALVDMTKGDIIRVLDEDWNGVAFDTVAGKFVGTHMGIETIDEDFRDVAQMSLEGDDAAPALLGAHSGMYTIQN